MTRTTETVTVTRTARLTLPCASDDGGGDKPDTVTIRRRAGGRNEAVGIVIGTHDPARERGHRHGPEVCVSREDFLAAADAVRAGEI